MSLLKANSVQIGQSSTATNNFTLSVPTSPDGTIKLARGNSGATTQDILTVNSAGAVTLSNGGSITLGTAQNSTSGTAIDFTGIPSWAKKMTVMLNGVSTNGSSLLLVRIGISTGIESTGYTAGGTYIPTTPSAPTAYLTSTAGFVIPSANANAITSGIMTICNISSNTWVYSFSGANTGESGSAVGGGTKTLGGTLDRIRITTVNGTDTFDAGSINIMYEG